MNIHSSNLAVYSSVWFSFALMVVDDVIRFVSQKSQEKVKSSWVETMKMTKNQESLTDEDEDEDQQ